LPDIDFCRPTGTIVEIDAIVDSRRIATLARAALR
jgi:hypothetical protein